MKWSTVAGVVFIAALGGLHLVGTHELVRSMKPDPDHLLAELAACRAEILRLREQTLAVCDDCGAGLLSKGRCGFCLAQRVAELEQVLSDTADELANQRATSWDQARTVAAVERARAALSQEGT